MTMPFTSFSSKRIYIFHFWTSTLSRQNRQFGWKFSYFPCNLSWVYVITAGGLIWFIFVSFSKWFFVGQNEKKREFLRLEFKSNFLLLFSLVYFQTAKKRPIHVFRTSRPDFISSATASPMWVSGQSSNEFDKLQFFNEIAFFLQIQLCFG